MYVLKAICIFGDALQMFFFHWKICRSFSFTVLENKINFLFFYDL